MMLSSVDALFETARAMGNLATEANNEPSELIDLFTRAQKNIQEAILSIESSTLDFCKAGIESLLENTHKLAGPTLRRSKFLASKHKLKQQKEIESLLSMSQAALNLIVQTKTKNRFAIDDQRKIVKELEGHNPYLLPRMLSRSRKGQLFASFRDTLLEIAQEEWQQLIQQLIKNASRRNPKAIVLKQGTWKMQKAAGATHKEGIDPMISLMQHLDYTSKDFKTYDLSHLSNLKDPRIDKVLPLNAGRSYFHNMDPYYELRVALMQPTSLHEIVERGYSPDVLLALIKIALDCGKEERALVAVLTYIVLEKQLNLDHAASYKKISELVHLSQLLNTQLENRCFDPIQIKLFYQPLKEGFLTHPEFIRNTPLRKLSILKNVTQLELPNDSQYQPRALFFVLNACALDIITSEEEAVDCLRSIFLFQTCELRFGFDAYFLTLNQPKALLTLFQFRKKIENSHPELFRTFSDLLPILNGIFDQVPNPPLPSDPFELKALRLAEALPECFCYLMGKASYNYEIILDLTTLISKALATEWGLPPENRLELLSTLISAIAFQRNPCNLCKFILDYSELFLDLINKFKTIQESAPGFFAFCQNEFPKLTGIVDQLSMESGSHVSFEIKALRHALKTTPDNAANNLQMLIKAYTLEHQYTPLSSGSKELLPLLSLEEASFKLLETELPYIAHLIRALKRSPDITLEELIDLLGGSETPYFNTDGNTPFEIRCLNEKIEPDTKHPVNIIWNQLAENEELGDITIQGTRSSRKAYSELLLKECPDLKIEETLSVELNVQELAAFITYCYTGSIPHATDDLLFNLFLKADALHATTLKGHCSKLLFTTTSTQNVLNRYRKSVQLKTAPLTQFFRHYIKTKARAQFPQFSPHQQAELIDIIKTVNVPPVDIPQPKERKPYNFSELETFKTDTILTEDGTIRIHYHQLLAFSTILPQRNGVWKSEEKCLTPFKPQALENLQKFLNFAVLPSIEEEEKIRGLWKVADYFQMPLLKELIESFAPDISKLEQDKIKLKITPISLKSKSQIKIE